MDSKPAFTMAEVLLALLILAVSMTILSNLQIKSMLKISSHDEMLKTLFWAKQHISQQANKSSKTIKPYKGADDTGTMQLTSRVAAISKKSSLYPVFKQKIALFQTTASFKQGYTNKEIDFVSFMPESREYDQTTE